MLCKAIIALVIVVGLGWLARPVFAGNPPDAAHSTLVGNNVPADGTTQSTITITLHDSSDVPLSGDTVSLSAPGDSTAVFSPSSTTLNASGVATFSATSTQVGTDAITVTDTTTSTTLSALGNVIFDPVPTSASVATGPVACNDTVPGIPDLYQVIPTKTAATIYIAPPNTVFDGFTISYGLTNDANNYSFHVNQSSVGSALKFNINDLTANTIYYFKVRATNGCANGPWSGVVSTQNTTNLKTLPATGPSNLVLLGEIGGVLAVAGLMIFFAL